VAIFPESDPETQMEILFGLAHVQSPQAVPVLGAFVANAQSPEKVRIKAAEALGQIGNPAAIPFLVDLIRRRGRIFTSAEPLDLRVAAAQALMGIGTPPALEALKKLVVDEPRGAAREALARILPAEA
jgi:HEAT repeat protein